MFIPAPTGQILSGENSFLEHRQFGRLSTKKYARLLTLGCRPVDDMDAWQHREADLAAPDRYRTLKSLK